MVKQEKTFIHLFFKLVSRAFTHSWLQFLSVISIMGIAITLFIGLTSNAKGVNNRVNELYFKSNMADIYTSVSTYDTNDDEQFSLLGDYEKRYQISGEVNGKNGTLLFMDNYPTISKPYKTDNNNDTDFFIVDQTLLKDEVNHDKWLDGNDNYKKADVTISFSSIRAILEEQGIFTLLNLVLKPGKSNFLDASTITFKAQITGTMIHPENVESAQMNDSSFLMSKSVLKTCFDEMFEDCFYMDSAISQAKDDLFAQIFTYNQYLLKIKNDASINDTNNKINSYYSSKSDNNLIMSIDVNHLSSNVTIQSDIKQASQLAYIFPLIFFLVGVLVVLTTTSQLILKERIQIGTLKAIGVSKRRIVSIYSSLTMLVVFIGIVIGSILGPLILPGVMNKKYDILYTLPPSRYTVAIPELLITIISCLLVTFLVTFFVLRKEINLQPSESMRPRCISTLKYKGKNKTIKSTRLISIKMALRNIRLNLVKSLMVVIGISGCTALLVSGFGIDNTLNKGINHDMNMIYTADISAKYNVSTSLKEKIDDIEGISDIVEFSTYPANAYFSNSSSYTVVYSIPSNSNHYFNGDDNYEIDKEVAISQKIAINLSLKVGDEFSFTVLGETYKGIVGHIFNCFYVHGIFVNADDEQYASFALKYNSAWMSVKDGYNHGKVASQIKEQIAEIPSCSTKEENKERIGHYMESISLMTLTVKIFAILLAIVTLYNLALLNFKERIRDIATLKVLGFNQLEIMRSLLFEVMLLTTVGAIIGLFLGKPLEILVLSINRTPIVEFLYTVYPLTYLISFIITFFTALIVNFILSLRCKKVSMVESLKSVE